MSMEFTYRIDVNFEIDIHVRLKINTCLDTDKLPREVHKNGIAQVIKMSRGIFNRLVLLI